MGVKYSYFLFFPALQQGSVELYDATSSCKLQIGMFMVDSPSCEHEYQLTKTVKVGTSGESTAICYRHFSTKRLT